MVALLHHTQSLTGHQTVNMKVVLALACVVAGASAYPMFFLEEADPVEYYPVHRVARQIQEPRPFNPNRRAGPPAVEDSIPAADTPYGHAVSFFKFHRFYGTNFINWQKFLLKSINLTIT